MKKVLYLFLILTATLLLSGCDLLYANHPTFSCLEDFEIGLGEEVVNPNCDIKALSKNEGDITENIVITGDVDNTVPGTYQLTYSVRDSTGKETTETVTVTVKDMQLSYPTGTYNYRFANTELRYTFLAAAEKWLVENQIGGIPLNYSYKAVLYSNRVQLPIEKHLPVIGFGEQFATMSSDDQSVVMYDGEPGNVDEYTFRKRISINPITFNQWLVDNTIDSELMTHMYDSLYRFEYNEDKTGYLLNPSMAESLPIPINPTLSNTGEELSTRWTITIKDDLMWYFHPNIQSETGFDPNDYSSEIKASDFVATFKIALDNDWFRAISGGGDLLTGSRIKGIKEYKNDEIAWSEVGINVIDDYTIEFEFDTEQSEWSLKYFFSSFVMTPINTDLYNYLESNNILYGSTPYATGYHGAYYIDEYIEDTVVRLKANPNYHSDDFFYTGYDFLIIPNVNDEFLAYQAGKLDYTPIPISDTEDIDPNAKMIPGPTVYRLMINSLMTEANQLEYNPDSTWIPEPLLGHSNFKLAMYFAVNRDELANDILKSRTPSMYYFNEGYIVDHLSGVPYRNTSYGESVGINMYPETNGFNKSVSEDLFRSAVNDLIEQGYYQEGTLENPTIIDIKLLTYADSTFYMISANYIKESFESTFHYEEKHIQVNLIIETASYPDIYYDYMMPGEFDLAFGGISGSMLCPSSYLDMFRSDNKSGFFLNPGVDTSKAEIEVRYVDDEGNYHREMWSFDAISTVLMEEVYIENGVEIPLPDFVN